MEIPELIKQRLGGEEVEAAVNLGDEDLACFTASRTLIYRAEGLISDESVNVYDHDIERLDISEGRRKATFTLAYIDRTEEFSVARDRTDPVLKRLLAGVLHASDVTGDGESVVDVFRFSELTLVVTDSRLVKHIGASVWDEDYTEYPFTDVTGLDFEDSSVATQVVLSVEGRPQRIKAPTDDGRLVRQALERALFAFYDVDSLDQLNAAIGTEEPDENQQRDPLSLDDTISPLVDDETDDPVEGLLESDVDDGQHLGDETADEQSMTGDSSASTAQNERSTIDEGEGSDDNTTSVDAGTTESRDEMPEWPGERDEHPEMSSERPPAEAEQPSQEPAVDPETIEEMEEQLEMLTQAVGRQNKLLKKQQQTIEQLIEELRKQQ